MRQEIKLWLKISTVMGQDGHLDTTVNRGDVGSLKND